MPGYDRSGPMGNGPMSGGGRGVCGSAAQQRGVTISDRGNWGGLRCRRGFGKSGGGRFGRGYEPFAAPSGGGQQVNEKELLEQQARELQQSLTRIQKKLDEL